MASDRPSPFVALQHRNFRLLWAGQLISFAGSMMQTAAILWHVSLLVPAGQRAIALGMVGLVRLLPIVFFSIAGGAVADAWDRRRVMLCAQTAMGATAVVLAVPSFALIIEFVVWLNGDERYDDLAHEFTKLLSVSFSLTATFGSFLLFMLPRP